MKVKLYKTTVTEETAVCKFVQIMRETSMNIINQTFWLTGLSKFADLKAENSDEIDEITKLFSQIDIDFEWQDQGKMIFHL